MIRITGWQVNHKRVARIWRRAGLKVPKKQPRRRRLWLHDGSCIRLRPRAHEPGLELRLRYGADGAGPSLPSPLDPGRVHAGIPEVILMVRRITVDDVLAQLEDLFRARGVPDHLRSDNGPEFTAKMVCQWLGRLGVQTLFVSPGSPWENGYIESFNTGLQLVLSTEIFNTVKEAQIVIEQWRVHYNTERPRSSLGYRPSAPETMLTLLPAPLRYAESREV